MPELIMSPVLVESDPPTDPDRIALIVSLTALLVAVVALIYTIRTYWLKAGQKVRFSFSIIDTGAEKYVHSVTLENLKDRPLAVFGIYLEIGRGYFLELETFPRTPLIIDPFSVYQTTLDPVVFYSVNVTRVTIDSLLTNRKVPKRVVLATTNGRLRSNAHIGFWDPVMDFFNNAFAACIQPRRLPYKSKAYDSSVRFLLDVTLQDGKQEVIPLRQDDYRWPRLSQLQLTQAALESKEALTAFIARNVTDKTVDWKTFEVYDYRKEVEAMMGYESEPQPLGRVHPLIYHLLGRPLSIIQDWRLRAENRARARTQKTTAGAKKTSG